MSTFREQIEEREKLTLSQFATLSIASEGRVVPEEPDPLRTCFMRDRDRILHSKPFRRLKHKTQVFISPAGDHYRTRLTHTLEVAQIARTISRILRLNEDLTEAIALSHDVGHTPFGHAGEQALDAVLAGLPAVESNQPTEFRHYDHSLRVVDVLTPLNLTFETRAGISGHSKGRADLTAHDGEPTSTLEAAVVRISDRIAYLNHDLDDALRSGIISKIPERFDKLGQTHSARIKLIVGDVITHSENRPHIGLSDTTRALMNDLKEWMFDNVYLSEQNMPEVVRAQSILEKLFAHYCEPGNLPEGFTGIQGAVDYVAGMTDRFALNKFDELGLKL